jgi:hypothetical protein
MHRFFSTSIKVIIVLLRGILLLIVLPLFAIVLCIFGICSDLLSAIFENVDRCEILERIDKAEVEAEGYHENRIF